MELDVENDELVILNKIVPEDDRQKDFLLLVFVLKSSVANRVI